MEISQVNLENDLGQLQMARSEFDFIVIDLGVLRNIAAQLTGKRWESEAFIWTSTYADELWLLSKSDQLSLERLRELLRELAQNSIKPAIVGVQSMRTPGKKNSPLDQSFTQSVSAIKPARMFALPADSRSVLRAESERASLHEVNERSHLRRSIAELAGQLIS
jgi:Flp pilus assembly CpaE family ATPase